MFFSLRITFGFSVKKLYLIAIVIYIVNKLSTYYLGGNSWGRPCFYAKQYIILATHKIMGVTKNTPYSTIWMNMYSVSIVERHYQWAKSLCESFNKL